MGLCKDGFKGFLFHLFNVIFLICGAVLIGVGIWLAVVAPPFVGDEVNTDLWWSAVGTVTAVGIAIILVGISGCCGVKRHSPCCLNLYVILIIIIIAAELTLGIVAIVFRTEIDSALQDSMLHEVTHDYDGVNDPSKEWDNVQKKLKCCGANSFLDYRYSSFHNSTGKYVPDSCCNTDDSDELVTCRTEAENSNIKGDFLFTEGCYDATKDIVRTHSAVMIGLGFGFAGIQALNILFACGLKRKYIKHPIKKTKGKK